MGRLTATMTAGAIGRTTAAGFFTSTGWALAGDFLTGSFLTGDFLAGLPADDFFALGFPGLSTALLP